jgi:NAD(P)H-nitrite reductase large subunit
MDHVVIGAGPAGVVAVEHIRKLDADANIVLVGDEPEPPYSRMAIPYYLVRRIDEAGTYLRKDSGHFSALGIELIRDRATSIDSAGRSVALENGGSRRYDRLLIASGSSPLTPPISGVDLPGVYHCWTLEDARNIIKLMEPGNSVVLIGAGFIGCIILEALAASGVKLTVVETENRMVPRMMNDVAGGMIKDWCAAKGVNVLTSTRVTAIEQENPLLVQLDNGEAVGADMVITATGVASNTAFLEGSGIDVDSGIVVDEYLQTSVAGVYAAGDCAQGKDFSTGGYSVQAIQPTAVEHGMLAARNMVQGHTRGHRGEVNMNVLDTLGLISSSFGMWMGVDGGDSAERVDRDRFKYINLQFEQDRLVGASALGLTDHVGVLRGMIQSETRLGEWKSKLKSDPTRLMEAYLASTQVLG